jgi:hypothetical protein
MNTEKTRAEIGSKDLLDAFEVWFKEAFTLEDRMTNPSLLSEQMLAFAAGWRASNAESEARHG